LSPTAPSADQALQRLIDGNERFRRGEVRFPGLVRETLKGLVNSQQPFATILGCSDSRVPPELIFDTGLGELFVVRVAGNIFSPEVAGSLQYAASHLNTPLFLVLGHQGCGAVKAAVQTRDHGEQHRSRIQTLVDNILKGLPPSDPTLSAEEHLAKAIESNVRWTVKQIVETPEGQARLAENKIKIVGAIYQVTTGQVRLLDQAGQ
jgi:carbonic anhydrase